MLKIVLTGGPCAGKSEALSKLTQILEGRGYKVITVPEAATHMILNGVRPSPEISMVEFQNFVLQTQINNEDTFSMASEYINPDKLIFFYDRGIMDACAYVDKETEFKPLLEKRNMNFSNVFARYDAVLHLVTAADGAEKYYQWNDPNAEGVGNNAARGESPEEARKADKKTLDSWIGHPHLRVFDNSTDFEGKIRRIVEEVFALLGEPVPKEIERKFLIKKPTPEQIESLGCMSETHIIQTYLNMSENMAERRVRQRGTKESGYTFYYTEKSYIAPGVRVEDERKISPTEYLQYLTEANTSLHQISKKRYCFVYDKQYFEMDIYPFSDEYAILEIELNDLNEPINFPPLSFIKEVTGNTAYSNYTLANTMLLVPDLDGKSFFKKAPDLDVSDDSLGAQLHALFDREEKYVEPDANDVKAGIATDMLEDETLPWLYETGREEPEILGSGSQFYSVVTTRNKDEAFKLFGEAARNYLERKITINGKRRKQFWNGYEKEWEEFD